MNMFKRRDQGPEVETLISRSVRVNGDVEFSGGLHVDGRVMGSVHATPGSPAALSVSEHGVIEGSVSAGSVVLNGRIHGNIQGSERVVLGAKSRVRGDVHYGVIEMAEGAQISGKLVPHRRAAAAAPVVAETAPALGSGIRT
jgi:cytoskeletal protein CcmA (bactofilin family)